MPSHFGTRFLVLLLLRALNEYARHKGTIDLDISDDLRGHLDGLLTLLAEIDALNAPGPV